MGEIKTSETIGLDVRLFAVTDSANLEAVGYHLPTRTLRVVFKGGRMYDYTDVPPETFAELVSAPSMGSYHAHKLRGMFDAIKYIGQRHSASGDHSRK